MGTSGNKATLYSTEGELVKSCVHSYDMLVSNNNWVEQRPEDFWNAVCISTKELVQDIDVNDIAAISFSGQMMGCICVDKEGRALRNALIWADMRATREEEMIRERISEEDFYHLTGHKISPSYGGQKLMWVKNNEPEIYENTYKMLNCKDYIILKLTGEFVTEYTDASSTNLLDLNKLEWSDRLLEVMGIDREKMPALLKSTDVAGTVTDEAAKACGLVSGIPVVCGGGDGVCAAVGTGCTKEGIAHSCMGTSSWISITTEKPIYDEEMRTFTWAHIVPGYVLPTGTMQCGGGSYSWFTKELC
ncbi:FGGY-family carbohydrate kinase, partial [Eubacterium callanderi]|uniref:FGGY-family carbohydrate kinase n=1 Tax=Eubacterium callanderi TaxID=53442 RepID=UPI0034A4AEFE